MRNQRKKSWKEVAKERGGKKYLIKRRSCLEGVFHFRSVLIVF